MGLGEGSEHSLPRVVSQLMQLSDLSEVSVFRPRAIYHHGLDYVEYLGRNVLHTGDWIDPYLTLHRNVEGDVVGVRFDGFKHVFFNNPQVRVIPSNNGGFMPLALYIDAIRDKPVVQEVDRETHEEGYRLAREYVCQVTLTPEDMQGIFGGRGE